MPRAPAFDFTTRAERKLRRKAALWLERESWVQHWQDLAKYQMPRSGRFLSNETNRGGRRDNHIYDNTATFAQRTLAAGMMAGMTSPARPWFRLGLMDKDLQESPRVKAWLHDSTRLLLSIFAQGNAYRVLHGMYAELGVFGTSAAFLLPDFDDVVRLYPMTIGEYGLACNDRGEVDTIAREFQMQVGPLVERFGLENTSATVKNYWDMGNFDVWIPVVHLVEPNRHKDGSRKDHKGMPYLSTYIEVGADNPDKFLREAGFQRFPALTPRWEVVGNDIYGHSPGMECLGDVKQLQHEQLRKAQGIDYMVNPPLQVPSGYKEFAKARLPGGVFHVDNTGPGGGIRSAFEVNLRLDHLQQDIMDVRDRINSAYYADLFLMMANDTRTGITATEVMERHEEKMLMLGPVLERLHNEMLTPLVEVTFDRCAEVGILPTPPEEVQGKPFEVEFISTLAQAQRAITAGNLDQVTMRIGQIAQMNPEVLDKVNTDGMVDEVADMFGINPDLIRPDEEVAAIREQRQQAMAAQQMAETAEPAARAAKDMSEVDAQNAREVAAMFQGYGT